MTGPSIEGDGSPIRVLWLIKGLGPGGAEQLLVQQAGASTPDRVHYEVAYLMLQKEHLVPALADRGVRAHCLDAPDERDVRWLPAFRRLVRDGGFQVVHGHSPVSSSFARAAVRSLPRRERPGFLYTEHSRWTMYRPATRWANRLTYGWNDHVVAVSDDVRATIDARLRDRVEVLRHGIDLASARGLAGERDAVRRELGVGAHETLVVTVANLRPVKGYATLMAAARRVGEAGAPVRFAAAGQGPQEDELRALHRDLGLGDRFSLLGYVPEAARLVAGADLFVLASQHEGMPVAVMEAFALGVPVVGTAVGGLREVVHPGENGTLVPVGDDRALAEAILELSDPHARAPLAVGAARSADQFSIAPAVARLEAIYRDLAARPR